MRISNRFYYYLTAKYRKDILTVCVLCASSVILCVLSKIFLIFFGKRLVSFAAISDRYITRINYIMTFSYIAAHCRPRATFFFHKKSRSLRRSQILQTAFDETKSKPRVHKKKENKYITKSIVHIFSDEIFVFSPDKELDAKIRYRQ